MPLGCEIRDNTVDRAACPSHEQVFTFFNDACLCFTTVDSRPARGESALAITIEGNRFKDSPYGIRFHNLYPDGSAKCYSGTFLSNNTFENVKTPVLDEGATTDTLLPRPQSTDVVAVSDPLLSRAVRFIREHACEGITVEDVLKAVPMSRSVLERRFKQVLARTPLDQILRVKIEKAQSLLATTDLALALIAERAGFEHVEYFSVVFKRLLGETPGRFRARNKA